MDHQKGEILPYYNANLDSKGRLIDHVGPFDQQFGQIGWGPKSGPYRDRILGTVEERGFAKDAWMDDSLENGSARTNNGERRIMMETAVVDMFTKDVLGDIVWGYSIRDGNNLPIQLQWGTKDDVSLSVSKEFKLAIQRWNKYSEYKVGGTSFSLAKVPLVGPNWYNPYP